MTAPVFSMVLFLRVDTEEVTTNALRKGKIAKEKGSIIVVRFPGQRGRKHSLQFRDEYIPAHYRVLKVIDRMDNGKIQRMECESIVEFNTK